MQPIPSSRFSSFWLALGWLLAAMIGCDESYTPPATCPEINPPINCRTAQAPYDSTEYILSFPDTVSCEERERDLRYVQALGARIADQCGCGLYLMKTMPNVDPNEHIQKAYTELKHTGGNGRLVRNVQFQIDPITPMDPGQFSYDSIRKYPPTSAQNVVVGIVDMGMYFDHPALRPYLWQNPAPGSNCFVSDAYSYNSLLMNGFDVNDSLGHGTHIAGIIALPSNQGSAYTHDPKTKQALRLMSVKMTKGSTRQSSLFAAICGVKYAIDRGADLLNLSWGYYAPEPDPLLARVMQEAAEAGVLVITAAGNDAIDTDRCPHWPSSFAGMKGYEHVISVGALNETEDTLACFSNFGRRSITIAAPGTDIGSLYLGNGCYDMTGTSMAAPFVTRYAAMQKLQRPGMDLMTWRNAVLSGLSAIVGPAGPSQKIPLSDQLNCGPTP